jgi:dienelactone hydrolase
MKNGAPMPPSRLHLTHLIDQLRSAAAENAEIAMADDTGGLGYCLGAALANDAADAIEALLQASVANDPTGRAGSPAANDWRSTGADA